MRKLLGGVAVLVALILGTGTANAHSYPVHIVDITGHPHSGYNVYWSNRLVVWHPSIDYELNNYCRWEGSPSCKPIYRTYYAYLLIDQQAIHHRHVYVKDITGHPNTGWIIWWSNGTANIRPSLPASLRACHYDALCIRLAQIRSDARHGLQQTLHAP